jgi:hypothetical protein
MMMFASILLLPNVFWFASALYQQVDVGSTSRVDRVFIPDSTASPILDSFDKEGVWIPILTFANVSSSTKEENEERDRDYSAETLTTTDNNDGTDQAHDICRVYLAKSTIPGAGLGIFVGVDVDADDEFSFPNEIIVPMNAMPNNFILSMFPNCIKHYVILCV